MCSKFHRGNPPRQGSLQPIRTGEPHEIVGIDLTGPHPTSKNGYKYIMTMIDHFSKWVEVVPLRNKEAQTVAEAFYVHWVSRLGTPQAILTDLGTEFQNQVLTDLCKLLGVQKLRTTAYHASTNGCTERFHRTMNSLLAKVVEENQRDWDTQLPTVAAAYRATKHDTTGYSPNQLVFGRENRAPLDIVLGTPEEVEESSVDAWVDDRVERQRQVYELVRNHTKSAAGRYKSYYDQKVHKSSFKEGDFVFVYYPRRYPRRNVKWQLAYDGPFKVIKQITDLTFAVQKSPRANSKVVHIDKLKLYRGPIPLAWSKPLEEQTVTKRTDPALNDSFLEHDLKDLPARRPVRRPAHLQDFVYHLFSESVQETDAMVLNLDEEIHSLNKDTSFTPRHYCLSVREM